MQIPSLAPIDRLKVLAKSIKKREPVIQQLRQQADAKMAETLAEALLQGQELIEAKGLCEHGEWLPWLEKHFPGHYNTAGKYMRLANSLHGGNLENIKSLRKAYLLLDIIKEKPECEPKTEPQSAPEPATNASQPSQPEPEKPSAQAPQTGNGSQSTTEDSQDSSPIADEEETNPFAMPEPKVIDVETWYDAHIAALMQRIEQDGPGAKGIIMNALGPVIAWLTKVGAV